MKKRKALSVICLSIGLLSASLPLHASAYDSLYDATEIFTRENQILYTEYQPSNWNSRVYLYYPDTCYHGSVSTDSLIVVLEEGATIGDYTLNGKPLFTVSECAEVNLELPADISLCRMITPNGSYDQTCAVLENIKAIEVVYALREGNIYAEANLCYGLALDGENLTAQDFAEYGEVEVVPGTDRDYEIYLTEFGSISDMKESYDAYYNLFLKLRDADFVENCYIKFGYDETINESIPYYFLTEEYIAGNGPASGDANENGTLEPDDFVLMLKDYANSMVNEEWTCAYPHCDLNDDGQTTADEVVWFMQIYAAALISK